MDQKLIDEAIAQLSALPRQLRTPEQIQGWARFICSAAGIEIQNITPTQVAQSELHAATALLAQQLGAAHYSTEFQLQDNRGPTLSAFIYVKEGVALYGQGPTAAHVLRALQQDASSRCLAVTQ